MRHLSLLLVTSLLFVLWSCNKDEPIKLESSDYLIFGHRHGECKGETCVETFKLTDTKLFEDTVDSYHGQIRKFIELDHEKYEQVKDLPELFPEILLKQSETTFGCPDCTDGGGIYVEYSVDGQSHSWSIDKNLRNVPEYLHEFTTAINEKIDLINK